MASEISTRRAVRMEFPALRRMKLGSQGFEVSSLGLGCMGMTKSSHGGHSRTKSEDEMVHLIRSAVDSGVTFLDTSDVYGPHINEILVGKALRGGYREKVQLATKFGLRWIDGGMVASGDPEYVRAACEASLKRLGVDCIDLYYQHRVDNRVPIEVTVGELKKLVEEGKIKYVGLSEACGSTIRRAHAVHPITAVQLEWSIFTRDMEEEVIPTCRELGIGIVAFSPLGNGFLPGGRRMVESLGEGDFRKLLPKLNPENLKLNEPIAEKVAGIAERKGCSPSQVALAWLYEKGGDVCPIPGTTKEENLKQNIGALAVKLTSVEMVELDGLAVTTAGERYPPGLLTWRESETPPLSSWKL